MARPLHIALAGPIATADVEPLLPSRGSWPRGTAGAPLMATLIEELLRRGHRVSAVTLSSDLPLRRVKHGGSRITAVGSGFSLTWCPMRPKAWPFNPTGGLGWLPGRIVDGYRYERRQLRAALQTLRPEIVHAHWAYEYAAAAIASRLPHLVTCHDWPREIVADRSTLRHLLYRWLRARLAAWVMRRAGALTAPSPWLAEVLAPQAGVPIAVVPNPLPPALCEANAASMRERAPEQRRRVLIVSHGFVRRKNVATGLRAFARLAATMPAAELVLLGEDMGAGQAAESWWRDQGLAGRVTFAGSVSPKLVRHWMGQSDVLLHPAASESFGMVLAEAMALGLPVVAGAASGAVPWVVGDGGWLVDVQSEEPLAAALAEVLGDRAAASRRAARARATACQRFAAPIVGDLYEDQYRVVLERAAAAPKPRFGLRRKAR